MSVEWDTPQERITWKDAMSWDASRDIVPLSGDAGDVPVPRWDTEAQEKYLDDHVRHALDVRSRYLGHDHGWDTGPGDRLPRRDTSRGHPMAAWDTSRGHPMAAWDTLRTGTRPTDRADG